MVPLGNVDDSFSPSGGGVTASTTRRASVRKLAAARLASIAGSEAAAIALAFTIYQRTHSAVWLSASFLLTFGVAGLLSPIAGTMSDRLDRKRLMIASELVAGLLYAVLVLVREPAAMIALAFGASVAHAPFGPASAAAIPNLAAEEDLTWANGLVSVGGKIGSVVGPVLGGGLLAATSVGAVFALNAVSFLISALLIATVHGSFRSEHDEPSDEYEGVWAGFMVVFGDTFLRSVAIAWAIMWFAVNIVVVADVPLATNVFAVGAAGLGLLYTCDSLGGVVGAITARRVPRRWERAALLSDMVAIAIAYTVVALSPWFVLVLVALAFGLGFDTLSEIVGTTIIQRRTDDAVRGRVFAAIGGLGMAANVVAFVIAGPLLDLLGPRGMYGFAAATAVVAGFVIWPAVRSMKQPDPATG